MRHVTMIGALPIAEDSSLHAYAICDIPGPSSTMKMLVQCLTHRPAVSLARSIFITWPLFIP
jgi:hypothetical protein